MKNLTIGDLARKTGLRSSTLRYYENVGILPRPARVSGRRCYDEGAIRQVDMVRFAQHAGFTLKEIKTLLRGFGDEAPLSARWRTLAQKKLNELDLLTTRIEQMRQTLEVGLKCGCIRVEDCTLTLADVPERSHSESRPSCSAC